MKFTQEEIKQRVADLDILDRRIGDVLDAAKHNPTSRDIARMEEMLCRRFNLLLEELAAAGVDSGFKPKVFCPEESQKLSWLQECFVREGIDVRDLLREDKPAKRKQGIGDGLGDLVGY